MIHASMQSRTHPYAHGGLVDSHLSWFERLVLLISIVEIPLAIDKYFFFREEDAMLGSIGGLCISITTMCLIVLYSIWCGDIALHRRRLVSRPLFGIPMVCFLAIVLMSSMVAYSPTLTLFEFGLLLQMYLLFFFIANRVQTQTDVLFCLVSLAGSLLLESLLIFFSAAIGMDDETLGLGPLSLSVDAGRRFAGTLDSPVLAGSTMAMMWLPVAASLLFIRNKWLWLFTFAVTLVGMLAVLLTQTRGAILTCMVGVIIIGGGMLYRAWLPKWTMLIALLLGTISVYPLYLVYQKRILHGDGGSAVSREHLSKIALQTISNRPLFGYGAGNCHLATQRFADQASYRAEWFYTIHSKFLLVWVETGIIGLLAFVAILGNGFRQGITAWRKRDPVYSPLALALVAALAGHVLHMTVDVFNSRPQVQVLWVMLGLIAAVYKLSTQAADRVSPAFARRSELRSQAQPTRRGHGVATPWQQIEEGVV